MRENRINCTVLIGLVWTSLLVQMSMAGPDDLSNTKYLRDYAETRGFNLGRPTHAIPTPDGDAVLFLRGRARTPKLELFEFNVGSGQTRQLLTPEDILKGAEEKLSAEEKALRERMRVSVGGFTGFELSKDGRSILLTLSGKPYVVDRASGHVQELKTRAGSLVDPKFSPNGKSVSYILDHDVYAYDLKAEQERPITQGGTEAVSHGLAEFVAREEMLRFSGYWWSPDSKFIAYQESDARDVEIWYVSDPAKPGEAPYPARYPRPGKSNVKVRLGIVLVAGGDTVWIDWDREHYPYLTTVQWDEHGPLTIAVQTRDQKELQLLKVDPATGRTHSLLTETDAAWVNVRQDVPRWLGSDKGFLWASERSASAWQLELRRPDGALDRVVVPPSAGFRSLIDVDPTTAEVTFTARLNPTEWSVFRMALDGAPAVDLTPGRGCRGAQFDKHHTIYVGSKTALQSMPTSTVYRRDGRKIGELPSVAEEPPFTPNVEITTTDSDPVLWAALVRPHDFDRDKRYPVIVHVYGGPLPDWSSGTVVASESAWLLPQWIADQGFVVVALDGRGTPGRGHDWERAIAGRFGSVPLDDQVNGFLSLAHRYRELDIGRVGIYGWSFGGYMSALAVLKAPKLFKAAVAGAPPTDWYDYDTHYTERYLGIPPAAGEAYEQSSLLTYAPKLERPLLLIHGTGDDNVYFRHSLKLVDALFRAGKQCEILPLSGLTHMVPDPVVNEQLYSRLLREFKRHL